MGGREWMGVGRMAVGCGETVGRRWGGWRWGGWRTWNVREHLTEKLRILADTRLSIQVIYVQPVGDLQYRRQSIAVHACCFFTSRLSLRPCADGCYVVVCLSLHGAKESNAAAMDMSISFS